MKLRPSSAYRWLACPGSPRMEMVAPVPLPSPYAQEGTDAHAMAEKALKEGTCPSEVPDPAVRLYVDHCAGYPESHWSRFIERKLQLGWMYPNVRGTADFVAFNKGEMHVVDYKHGQGVPVSIENNPQLRIYGFGAYIELYPHKGKGKIHLTIIQPRCEEVEPIRTETLMFDELRAWRNEVLVPGVEACKQPYAPLVTGSHCRFCPALGICPAQANGAIETVPDLQMPAFPPAEALTAEQMAKVLAFIDLFGPWSKQVAACAQDAAEKGKKVPGYKLVRRRSNRKWIDQDDAGKELACFLDDDELYEQRIVSPAKAEKALKAKGEELDPALYEKPDTGLTLAKESDKREEVRVGLPEEMIQLLDIMQ